MYLQTYVEALKKKGNFEKDIQLIALNKGKDIFFLNLVKIIKTTLRPTMMSIPRLPPRLRQA